jgi:hypothetical protein
MDDGSAVAVQHAALGVITLYRWPFPEDNDLLQLIGSQKPWLFDGIKYAYDAMLFTTPCIALSVASSLAYIFARRPGKATGFPKLPAYPDPTGRKDLFVVIGELHHPKRPESVEEPRWRVLPSRGLFTGIAVFGAIGTGKTSGCMYPFAEQVLTYQASDPLRRIGGLVLEVKGDFCRKVRGILKQAGRESDYVAVSLESPYRYNPLYNDLDAYSLAYGIASLLNNLFGKGKEPFWQQAYTNLVKFIILLHKVLYDYVTLFDVYECAINPELIEQKIAEGDRLLERRSLLVTFDDFMADKRLENYPFERDSEANRMKAPYSAELEATLREGNIGYELQNESGQIDGSGTEAPTENVSSSRLLNAGSFTIGPGSIRD